MLSDTMKLFFNTWQRQAGVRDDSSLEKVFKKKSFVQGHRMLFERSPGIRFADSGLDLLLLEQVVMARNRVHHHNSHPPPQLAANTAVNGAMAFRYRKP